MGEVVSTFVYATGVNVPDYMVRAGVTYRILRDHSAASDWSSTSRRARSRSGNRLGEPVPRLILRTARTRDARVRDANVHR